jgi:hypothetical protein
METIWLSWLLISVLIDKQASFLLQSCQQGIGRYFRPTNRKINHDEKVNFSRWPNAEMERG